MVKTEENFLQDFGTGVEPLDTSSASATALEVDPWGMRKGAELLESSNRLKGLELSPESVADFHAAAFEPQPRLNPSCTDSKRLEFLQTLLETQEFQNLHASTQLQQFASEIAAVAFAEQFVAQVSKQANNSKGEFAQLKAAALALAQATREVSEAKDAAAGLGLGPGSPGSNDSARIGAIYKRVRSSKQLLRITNLAGRFRRFAQSRQRQKAAGREEVTGIHQDGDPSRLLPMELVGLLDPETEMSVLRRIAERQSWCREYSCREPVGQGPVIVVVDESGSMAGERNETAKALALAMAWIAQRQKRWCVLIAFSGDTGERILPLLPGRWNQDELMGWLEAFLGGGSDLDIPIREMPEFFERLKAPRGKTDLIFLTDAVCKIEKPDRENFLRWKKSVNARLISLVLSDEPGDLQQLSDEIHLVRTLDVSEAGVDRILSL